MPPERIAESDYKVLGLRPGAKPADIKRAYRTLAKKWHPDRFHSESFEARALAEQRFLEIDEAYRRLIKNWGKGTGPAGKAGPRQGRERAAAGAEKTADDSGAEPHADGTAASGRKRRFGRATAAVYRKIQASGKAKLFVIALFAAALLVQVHAYFWSSPPETESVAPLEKPAAQPESAPGAASSPEKLLSEIKPPPPPPLMQSAPQPNSFTIGSSSAEVLRIQGKPSRVQGQTWFYGLSEIHFRNGVVWRFNNFDGSLQVQMLPGSPEKTTPPHFTVGSTQDEVLLVQGTPTRIELDKWFYGFSEVRFKDGRVKEYDNYFGTLKVRLLPSPLAGFSPQKYFFTIGSTQDEVMAVQGTPTTIQGNSWSYNFSYIFFREGKVSSISDTEGNLRFIAPENLPNGSERGPADN